MRLAFGLIVLGLVSGCSVSAGAGAGARFGSQESYPSAECDSFESCDVAYQDAVENAQRCHDEDADCEDADRNVRVTYGALREQTTQELGALRGELEERDGAVNEEESVEPEQDPRVAPGHAPETPPTSARGNTWFESEYGSEY